ncbi:hypothetical protein D4764_15G0011810 [Takifugu flavidus]|uniref:Uncharacterized protein n=1 Tax=Takifugu flavidus TaxID=433684 RepID=A0A5C6P380_9TELE|nr:hypothetical protein D4764_15G0011810 [Takifugu flavidus]
MVCADDVLTKEEQIGLLFRAKRTCEGNIKAKHKLPQGHVREARSSDKLYQKQRDKASVLEDEVNQAGQ